MATKKKKIQKLRGMQKRTIIKKIKAIINKVGELTLAQMELDSSPCFSALTNVSQLVETFGHHKVTVVTYVNDNEMGEDYIAYELLEKDLLMEILEDLEAYEVADDKLMGSIKNENF